MNGSESLEEMLDLALQHSLFTEAGEAQLLALPEPRFLFHLLDCEECRDLAWAKLGASEGVDTGSRPAGSETGLAADREAEELFLELLALPRTAKKRAIREPRFHNLRLIDLLLEAGEDAGRRHDVQKVEEIASLAVKMGDQIPAKGVWDRDRYFRAYCLAGGAGRLAGDLDRASMGYRGAAWNLTGASSRAAYCRGLAMLRWEQGFGDEAMALLRHAAGLFGELRERQEEAACLALLGLVHVEVGALDKGLGPLLRGCMLLEPKARPWLTVRCFLATALCLAANSRLPEARGMLERSWMLYPLVTDAGELIMVEWLEGRVASFLRDLPQAEGLLASARQKLLAADRLAEAGAATLDLAALYAEDGKLAEVDALIEALRQAKAARVGEWFHRLFEVVEHFREMEPVAPARMRAALLSAELFQRARHLQTILPPLPWV